LHAPAWLCSCSKRRAIPAGFTGRNDELRFAPF
jgi:hypothetical protein